MSLMAGPYADLGWTRSENGRKLRWKVPRAELPGLVVLKVTECRGFVPPRRMLAGKPTQNIYVLAGHRVGESVLHYKIKQVSATQLSGHTEKLWFKVTLKQTRSGAKTREINRQ